MEASDQFLKMEEDINFLKENYYVQSRDIKEIKEALLGTEFHDGFKQQIEKSKTDIKELKTFKQKIINTSWIFGKITAGIATIGIIVAIVKNWTSIF